MDDETKGGGIIESLKLEWALFWASLSEDDNKTQNPRNLDFDEDEISEVLKALSDKRNQINKRLESLKREIELNSAKVESMRLVGSDPADTEENIQILSDEGFKLSEELRRLDEKLRQVHDHESEIA